MNIEVISPDGETHTRWFSDYARLRDHSRPADPNDPASSVTPITIANGVVATWTVPLPKAHDVPTGLYFVLTVSKDIGIGIIAHLIVEWIMDNFAGRAEKVIIERTEASFDRGELTKIVTETIYRERG